MIQAQINADIRKMDAILIPALIQSFTLDILPNVLFSQYNRISMSVEKWKRLQEYWTLYYTVIINDVETVCAILQAS